MSGARKADGKEADRGPARCGRDGTSAPGNGPGPGRSPGKAGRWAVDGPRAVTGPKTHPTVDMETRGGSGGGKKK